MPVMSPPAVLRGPLRLLASAAATLALIVSGALVGAPAASADSAIASTSGSFTVRGSGFGHGWGMSQYGAYGAAVKGLSWKQILAFYYPGTTRSSLSSTHHPGLDHRRHDGDLRLRPARGSRSRPAARAYTLPTGSTYKAWRISRSGQRLQAGLPTSSGALEDAVDRPRHGHLEGFDLQPGSSRCHARRVAPRVPRHRSR